MGYLKQCGAAGMMPFPKPVLLPPPAQMFLQRGRFRWAVLRERVLARIGGGPDLSALIPNCTGGGLIFVYFLSLTGRGTDKQASLVSGWGEGGTVVLYVLGILCT